MKNSKKIKKINLFLKTEENFLNSAKKFYEEQNYEMAIESCSVVLVKNINNKEARKYYNLAYRELKKISPDASFEDLNTFLSKVKNIFKNAETKEFHLIQKAKQLANSFIKEKYPDELPFFKMAWNALKDIQDIHLFNQKTIMSSLCITDTEVAEEELTVPIAIATIIITFRELEDNIDRIEKSELILKIENIAIKINATKKLAMELSKYIVEKIYKTENH